jgi:hypothetical protein
VAVSLSDVVSFGRYEPLFRIASGGMAEVYAARIRGEAGFQKLVAVKRMHPHLASDSGFVDMFLNEARLAAHVASPYVVQTLDLGRGSDGSLYIVMELVVGLSLAALESAGTSLPEEIAIELMAQAAQGLDDAHEATTPAGDALGLIHRDVSPHNILVGIDGRARVTDFGIARAVHRPRAETNVRELKGKFAYMSPEQTRLGPLDRRSDVFSLGVVTWELLVGERLFAEREPTACITNVRKKVVRPPHEIAPRVPAGVSAVVLQALDRDREARQQNAGELSEDLRRTGREAFGRLPDRRRIAAFIKEAGGEELERLQRLIRLGTEGAAPEAMEAVRPGATRILSGEGSGVARIGTGGARPVTALIDDPSPRIPTVTLGPGDVIEELEVHGTSTVNLLESDDLALARDEDEQRVEDAEDSKGVDERSTRVGARSALVGWERDPAAALAREGSRRDSSEDSAVTDAWDAVSAEDTAVPEDPTGKWRANAPAAISVPAVPSARQAQGAHTLRWLAIGATAGIFLVIGVIAALLAWPAETNRVPLPLEPTPAPAPEPRDVGPTRTSSPAPIGTPDLAANDRDTRADDGTHDDTDHDDTGDDTDHDDTGGDTVAGDTSDPLLGGATASDRAPPVHPGPAGGATRGRRSRRAHRGARGSRAEGAPVLMDVNAFDRHAQ